ncbi:MAG: hypothetical protein ACKVS5_04805 [Parvularculaceae bacterium]
MSKFVAGLCLLAAGLAGPAAAQGVADAATDAAIACLDVSDAGARLGCLENAARDIKATRVRPETAEESAAAEAAAAPVINTEIATEEDLFGAEALPAAKKAIREKNDAVRLSSKVVEFRVNRLGDLTAVLENGQVWRQLSSDGAVVRPSNNGKVYTVSIKRGPLGNYLMKINELDRSIRVRRIK